MALNHVRRKRNSFGVGAKVISLRPFNLGSSPGNAICTNVVGNTNLMKEFKVIIPEEHYSLLNFRQEDLPGVAVVNSALKHFEPKEVFAWHLSIMLDLKELIGNGMPSKAEVDVINKYEDFLDDKIRGDNKEKPNALFLARITWNATRELIWRVYDPEIVDKFLKPDKGR